MRNEIADNMPVTILEHDIVCVLRAICEYSDGENRLRRILQAINAEIEESDRYEFLLNYDEIEQIEESILAEREPKHAARIIQFRKT